MADTKEKTRKPQKFLFDMNCFDEGYVEEVIPEEPPPPVFSEQEVEAARKEGYERGRREAAAEAQASRERHIADLLGTIGKNFRTLFDAETAREGRFEREAVELARTIFTRLFPALNARQGPDEVEEVIATVLESRKEAQEIVIEVHPDYSESIAKRLENTAGSLQGGARISVSGNAALGPGDCRMNWNDGGARRDATGIAEEIHRQLEQLLAERAALKDNGSRNTEGEDQ